MRKASFNIQFGRPRRLTTRRHKWLLQQLPCFDSTNTTVTILKRSIVVGLLAALVSGAVLEVYAQQSPNTKNDQSTSQKADAPSSANRETTGTRPMIPEPKQSGGETQSIVQVANLVYAGVKSSHCFSDHFLVKAEKDSAISTSRRFHAVKSSSDEIFNFPMVIMTGEGDFTLTDRERKNLRQYVTRGGFLLASAGCSSKDWNQSFRKEMATIFPKQPLESIGMEHTIFNTVYEIKELTAKHGTPHPLEGITLGGRLGVLYSQDGLNDTAHTQGCCCCGGNEITNAIQVNVNILAYTLVF